MFVFIYLFKLNCMFYMFIHKNICISVGTYTCMCWFTCVRACISPRRYCIYLWALCLHFFAPDVHHLLICSSLYSRRWCMCVLSQETHATDSFNIPPSQVPRTPRCSNVWCGQRSKLSHRGAESRPPLIFRIHHPHTPRLHNSVRFQDFYSFKIAT